MRECDQWAEWRKEAALLPFKELQRHARVSYDNNHQCVECFCCACWSVLEDLDRAEAARRRRVRDNTPLWRAE